VRRMTSEGVNINGEDKYGVTGLQMAMLGGHTEVVRILLGCNEIKIDSKNRIGHTALYLACHTNKVECVQLFLAHNTCTKNIVRMVSEGNRGMTAEMVANKKGSHECARLIREYLENDDDTGSDRNEEAKLEDLTLSEVAIRIEEMNAKESWQKEKMNDEEKKELEELEKEYIRKRNDTLEKHAVARKKFCSEHEKAKKALCHELQRRLGTPPTVSLLHSCPVCLETMRPPLQIFSCANGHLICSNCKPRVTKCFCQAMYTGRATAMEQMVRTILNIE